MACMNKLFLSLLVILMPAMMASCCLNKNCPVKDEAAVEETTEEVQSQEIEAEATETEATAEATEHAGH